MAIRASDDGPLRPPENSPLTVQLMPMRRKHVRSVMRIEQQVYSHPWTTSLFVSELSLRTNRAYTIARVGSLIVGYSGLMFIGDDAHVSTIAVDPLWQRHRIASRLMVHNVRLALQNNARHLTLEVRASNEAAQAMYRKFGFENAGVRKNYYVEVNEDAVVMWANDIDSDDYSVRLSAIEAGIPGATVSELTE